MEKKYAILVVDMLNDFVTGALKCDRGLAIVPKTAELLNGAREKNIPVIFCNDAHLKGIDHELKLWGDHARARTLRERLCRSQETLQRFLPHRP